MLTKKSIQLKITYFFKLFKLGIPYYNILLLFPSGFLSVPICTHCVS